MDLRDFAYYSIYKNKGAEIADEFYKMQVKFLIAPYFIALVMGHAALSFRLGWKIPDAADGNVLIIIAAGLCVVAIYNFLVSPLEKIYNKHPIDIEQIQIRYKSLRWKFMLFFIGGVISIGMVPFLITEFL
ncbi:hypothetical protein GCM10027454_23710 [Algoriphagus aestuariicola]